MVSGPDTGRCASEDVGLPKRVDCENPHWLEGKTKYSLGSQRGWIVRTHIGWRGEQNILYKSVKASRTLGSPKGGGL